MRQELGSNKMREECYCVVLLVVNEMTLQSIQSAYGGRNRTQ